MPRHRKKRSRHPHHPSTIHFHKPLVMLIIILFSLLVFVSITPIAPPANQVTGMQVRLGERVTTSSGQELRGTNIYTRDSSFYLCNIHRAGGDFKGTLQRGDLVSRVLFFTTVETLDEQCRVETTFPYRTCRKTLKDNDILKWGITARAYCGETVTGCAIALIEDKPALCAVIIPENEASPNP